MTPVHLLLAAAEAPGPIAELVAATATQGLADAAGLAEKPGPSGVSTDVHAAQAWGSAQQWALDLGQVLEPEHLIALLVAQDHPGVRSTLEAAGLSAAELRRVALEAVGLEPAAAVPLQPLPPAGMGRVPPLPIDELPAVAWDHLRSRQERLPLRRVKRKSQWYAVLANEHRVVDRLLDSYELSPDERQSLLVHHRHAVENLLAEAAPVIHDRIITERATRPRHRVTRLRRHRRLRRALGVLDVFAGWGVWFGNRRSGLLRRWYRLTMPRG